MKAVLCQIRAILSRRMMVAALSLVLGISFVLGMSGVAQAASANDYYKNDRGSLQTTERYDTIQSKVGGMNNFEDTDPRRDTSQAEAKAKRMIEESKRRPEQANNPVEATKEAIDTIRK